MGIAGWIGAMILAYTYTIVISLGILVLKGKTGAEQDYKPDYIIVPVFNIIMAILV